MSHDPVRNVLGVVGSLRRGSYNGMLLAHAAAHAPDRMKIEVADGIIDLPLYNEDLDGDELPAPVRRAKDAVATADGVVIASPEYNFGVPGPVKNFVDWVSRPAGRSPFNGKPIVLLGASIGRVGGTVQCQGQLRISLAVCGAHVLPFPPVLLSEAASKFGDDGTLTDDLAVRTVASALSQFLTMIDGLAR